ncbi:MAG: helicase-associated domain-containing protein [Persicimonas sp.]
MRGQRSDKSRGSGGPLETDELESLFERGFSHASKRFLAEKWGLDPESEEAHVAKRVNDPEMVGERLESVSKLQRVTLSQVSASGGRMRGENLRRDLLLRGFGDTEEVLRELVEHSLLVPLPNPGESELDIEGLLEQDNFLQRDLAVPVPFLEQLTDEAESLGPEALGTWSGEIEATRSGSLETLELNLLHFSTLLQSESLRLNIDGTPNRRSLVRFGRGIILPGQTGEVADDLDLNDAVQLDYLTFLLALCLELDFVERSEQTIEGAYEDVEAFFRADIDERNRKLSAAFRGLRYWNEVESLSLTRGAGPADSEEHYSQVEPTGEPLIGARGYVLSVLKRARLESWTPTDAVIDLCAQLDRSYLPRALSKADPPVEPRHYIEAVLRRGLIWLGLIEFGESEDGVEMMRVTSRGAELLGMKRDEEGDLQVGPDAGECLVIQPNFEVMLFLETAPLEIVFRVYQIGQRQKLSDRVANFRLTAESVQRGLGMGLDADQIVEILNEYSHAPVPETVAFQIRDWERVHKKLELFANGVLLRHPDPDKLDLFVGQLRHEQRGSDFVSHRLSPTAVFIPQSDPPGLDRIATQHDGLVIDYLGEIPPSLYFVDMLEVMLDPMETDIVTASEIERIGTPLGDEGGSEARFYELAVGKIAQRWPENTLEEVIEFLDERTEGGLPAAQALRLRSLLEKPLEVAISRGVTVIVLESPDIAEHFASIPECEPLIERRLGDVAFAIKKGYEDDLNELLEELGIELAE